MDIEIIEMADRKMKFILKNSSPAMANALRRTLLSDIPKMAIDKVDFHLGPIMDDSGKEYESETPLFDEIIAHRLGMIPVPTDLSLFVPQDKCTCGGSGCPSCQIMYSLNKIGPCTVYSGDLMPLGDSSLKVKDEFIPIVELTDGQAILVYAYAYMGTARKHVKWQVCNGVGYRYFTRVSIDESKASDPEVLKCAEIAPEVFSVEGGRLVVKDPVACDQSKPEIIKIAETVNGVKFDYDDTAFVFKFETDGSMTAKQAFDKALEILVSESKDFKEQLEAL